MTERWKWARYVLAALFALGALNGLLQATMGFTGQWRDHAVLLWLQSLMAITGAAASVGSWRLAAWSPAAAVSYGVATGGMLAALPVLLSLEAEARGGIWLGAASVLAFGMAAGWYLRRVRRSLAAASSAAN